MSTIVGQNIFAALNKKKKTASRSKDAPREDDESKAEKHAEIEKAIFAAPAAGGSNWADDSDEEWGAPAQRHADGFEDGWNTVSFTSLTTLHPVHIVLSIHQQYDQPYPLQCAYFSMLYLPCRPRRSPHPPVFRGRWM